MSKIEDLKTSARVVLEHAREQYPHFESARGQADLLSLELALEALGEKPKEEGGLYLVCVTLDPVQHPEAGYWQTATSWAHAVEIVEAFELPAPSRVGDTVTNARGHLAIVHQLNTAPDHAAVLQEVRELVKADREFWG